MLCMQWMDECHKKQQGQKQGQKHRHNYSATCPHALRKYHCPQEVPQSLLGVTIFSEYVFPLWPIVFFVTCHNSLPPPPHPHPLSGAQIRSITGAKDKFTQPLTQIYMCFVSTWTNRLACNATTMAYTVLSPYCGWVWGGGGVLAPCAQCNALEQSIFLGSLVIPCSRTAHTRMRR